MVIFMDNYFSSSSWPSGEEAFDTCNMYLGANLSLYRHTDGRDEVLSSHLILFRPGSVLLFSTLFHLYWPFYSIHWDPASSCVHTSFSFRPLLNYIITYELVPASPACLVRLIWIVFVMGGRWPYSWCLVGCCL